MLSRPDCTARPDAICRYAWTPGYRNALAYVAGELASLGFDVREDAVGNLVASNVPRGRRRFGIGSHCDSNRNGGRYDGTLGVVTALELCRLNAELGLSLALQLISFVEEEGSGFGSGLLGSRIMAGEVGERELGELCSIDDQRSFAEHAAAAGLRPEAWRESADALDGLDGWLELHIEQGRVLDDGRERIGVVDAIAGYAHGDLLVEGRSDHAGATPMALRSDPMPLAAECVLELERLASAAGAGTVATVGALHASPGLITTIPARVQLSLDVRSVAPGGVASVVDASVAFARDAADRRALRVTYSERSSRAPTQLDAGLVARLEASARAAQAPFRTMASAALHDTAALAPHVPSAMVFVPCADGISHSPEERASAADAALGAEIMLNAIAGGTST